MSPLIKKVAAALAVKEVVDRVQEARRPRQSFIRRNSGKLLLLGLGGGAFYLYKNGTLQPLIEQVTGGSSQATYESSPYSGPPTTPPTGTQPLTTAGV